MTLVFVFSIDNGFRAECVDRLAYTQGCQYQGSLLLQVIKFTVLYFVELNFVGRGRLQGQNRPFWPGDRQFERDS